jgi:hypothetical protein
MCGHKRRTKFFKRNKHHSDGLQSQCIDCQREYRKTHYERNRQKYIDKAQLYSEAFRQWWRGYKARFSCPCGEARSPCIDFHHPNNDKEACVSELIHNCNKERVIAEVAKCTPLCKNCHAMLHDAARQ